MPDAACLGTGRPTPPTRRSCSGGPSRRRDCHFADALGSLHPYVETPTKCRGGCSRMTTVSPTARRAFHTVPGPYSLGADSLPRAGTLQGKVMLGHRLCLQVLFPLSSWRRHRLCLVFSLSPCLRHCLSLATPLSPCQRHCLFLVFPTVSLSKTPPFPSRLHCLCLVFPLLPCLKTPPSPRVHHWL